MSFFDNAIEFFKFLRDWARNYWQTFVGLYVLVNTLCSWMVTQINTGVALVTSKLALMVLPSMTGGAWTAAASGMAFINSFFPLQEAISLGVSLGALWAVCVAYRFVKSWIPALT